MPHSSSSPRLGDLERVVMEHLWESVAEHPEGVTVREVHTLFEGEREIAYTTVMTVLDRLAKKELVTRVRVVKDFPPAEVRVRFFRENGFLPLRPAQGLFFSETFREGGK